MGLARDKAQPRPSDHEGHHSMLDEEKLHPALMKEIDHLPRGHDHRRPRGSRRERVQGKRGAGARSCAGPGERAVQIMHNEYDSQRQQMVETLIERGIRDPQGDRGVPEGPPPPFPRRGALAPGLFGSSSAHRREADHIPALYRGAHDRGPRAHGTREGPRNRHGLRLPGGHTGRARRPGVLHRAHCRTSRKGRGRSSTIEVHEHRRPHRRRHRRVAGREPLRGIIVTAAAPDAPDPLMAQLEIGGKLVIPIGDEQFQDLMVYTKEGEDRYREENYGGCRFVKLIGQHGWKA